MAIYEINGGTPLEGTVTISGAKNAAVAILPAALLVKGTCRIENVPDISDVRILLSILEGMGARVDRLQDGVVEIEVAIGGCFRNVRALIDTGNSLQDPITLAPVIIVEAQMLQDCLPEELLQAVRRRDSGALEQLAGQYPRLRCRLLPYRGLQGEGHLLFALRPEWIRRLPDGKPVEQVLLGLTASPLCADGSYHALLHNHII